MTTELMTWENGALEIHTRADFTVSGATLDLMAQRLTDNTRSAYAGQWRTFVAWCASTGRTALPATAQTVAEYAGHLASLDRSPSSFDQAFAAIGAAHIEAGQDQPNMVAARAVRTAHKRNRAERGAAKKQSAPVTLTAVRAIVDTLDVASLAGLRDRAAVVLGYSGMLRRSELAKLRVSDLRFTDEGLIVSIRTSKTDKESVGATVQLPYGSHASTCPVRTVAAWVATLAERGAAEGPLLRRIRRGDVLDPAGLSGAAVNDLVKRLAAKAGVANVTAHGLRAGAPTDAARKGVPTSLIADHGRWSKTSPTVLAYVRTADKWRDNPLIGIGL